jgi:hypothetical protein
MEQLNRGSRRPTERTQQEVLVVCSPQFDQGY